MGQMDRFSALHSLGNALSALAMSGGNEGEVDEGLAAEACDIYRKAVRLRPPSESLRATAAASLGAALERLAVARQGQPDALVLLDEAVTMLQSASALSDGGQAWHNESPQRCDYLVNLGVALEYRAGQGGEEADVRSAWAAFEAAARLVAGPPAQRIDAAIGWARTALACGDQSSSLVGARVSVDLLPMLTAHALDPDDQERGLSRLTGLASSAAQLALDAGDHRLAVELLDHGRALLFSRGLDSRGDLTELREAEPELANRFDELVEAIDASPGVATSGAAAPQRETTEYRHSLDERWRGLLREIRLRPGFGGFLAPQPFHELSRAAADGPVVVLSAIGHCDALIVTQDDVDVLRLPDAPPEDLRENLRSFFGGLDKVNDPDPDDPDRGEAEITEVLAWLWHAVTGPVLDRLGYTAAPRKDSLPRLWWCPTGALSFLPFHASGIGATETQAARRVMDLAVSSYTPGLRALGYAKRTRREAAGAGTPRVMTVAPDGAPPAARREHERLMRAFPAATDLSGANATKASVTAALRGSAWANIACHGISDLLNPSSSRFRLADGELTVREISALRLTDAELAVASACETARTGASSDEALHLTAALQLAGFAEVVGTLWQVNDRIAAEIAADFYAGLARDLEGGAPAEPARTLHAAIEAAREGRERRPSLWAAYVHFGR